MGRGRVGPDPRRVFRSQRRGHGAGAPALVSSHGMFPHMGNASSAETARRVSDALQGVRDLLPREWTASWETTQTPDGPDGLMSFRAPDGQLLSFVMEVKSGYRGPTADLVHQATRWTERTGLPALIVVDYANPALREACAANEISFIDTTGWIAIDGTGPPGLLLRSQGARRSPVVRGTSMNRLDGPGAARVIRALWRLRPGFPVGVRDLAGVAGVSPGTVSKVLPTLESYGAVTRDNFARIVDRDRRLLLQRWTQDYDFRTSNRRIEWFLAPRGLRTVFERIHTIPKGFRLSSTGPTAAHNYVTSMDLVPVLPLTTAAYYTENLNELGQILGLVQAPQPAAANVILAEPRDLTDADLLPHPDLPREPDLLLPFGGGPSSVYSAPLPQVLADLSTMGGRHPELADQILQALPKEEPAT